jgi:ABC-type branched-subunit amino acid transport system permease subunit
LIVDRQNALRHSTTVGVLIAIAVTLVAPMFFSRFAILQITVFIIGAILAESLGLVWGIGGIMCFGQTAFFGLGGYVYAVAVENIGDSTLPIVLSILVPAAVAVVLGCFLFFARLGDIYIGVVTLCVSLILFDFGNSTQDRFYTIGKAALNGFNGMAGVPPINIPLDPSDSIDTTSMYFLCAGSLIAIYVLFKMLLASPFGRVAVAVRHNEIRAGLIGYNAAAIKLALFTIGAGVAGYAGCLFANWTHL